MASLLAYIGNDSLPIDAREGEEKLWKECPELLQTGETVVMAFVDRGGKGRDSSVFTSTRILIRDKQGMTGKKTKFTSIPYGCIRGFEVETAGLVDTDSELKVFYCEGRILKMDFVAGKTDIFSILRFFNDQVIAPVFGGGDVPQSPSPEQYQVNIEEVKNTGGNIFNILGSNATQIDAAAVEQQLSTEPTRVLVSDEKVKLAFKCGRDSFLCTTHRLLRIDVQGITGSRVSYQSVQWKHVKAFSVETGGNFFDRDSELILHTTVEGVGGSSYGGNFTAKSRIEVDFKKGQADIYAVQRFMTDKILGHDTEDHFTSIAPNVSIPGAVDSGNNKINAFFAFLGDDSSQINPVAMDNKYHSDPKILQNSEHVEMAFKGRRDMVLFTSKRFLVVDVKGIRGKKFEYFSVPWKSVSLYSVKTAGALDPDSEMRLWTNFNDVWWPPSDDDGQPPPIPRRSFIEVDFRKDKVDLLSIQRYLSARLLDNSSNGKLLAADIPVSPDLTQGSSDTGGLGGLIAWLGDDGHAVDPATMQEKLQDPTAPILMPDERVVLAYRSGRDHMVYTDRRGLSIDKTGFTGKSIEYLSIPYRSIRGFSVETAGSIDTDAEVKMSCAVYWQSSGPGSKLKQDVRKGKGDVMAIQSLLAAQVIGNEDGTAAIGYNPAGEKNYAGIGATKSLIAWATGDGVEIDPNEATRMLCDELHILQSDETVERCYRIGRDLAAYSSKRIMYIDRQGLTGTRVEYKSYPLRYCGAFSVKTPGRMMFSDAAVKVYTHIPGQTWGSELKKKEADSVWGIHAMLYTKLITNRLAAAKEDEIVIS